MKTVIGLLLIVAPIVALFAFWWIAFGWEVVAGILGFFGGIASFGFGCFLIAEDDPFGET